MQNTYKTPKQISKIHQFQKSTFFLKIRHSLEPSLLLCFLFFRIFVWSGWKLFSSCFRFFLFQLLSDIKRREKKQCGKLFGLWFMAPQRGHENIISTYGTGPKNMQSRKRYQHEGTRLGNSYAEANLKSEIGGGPADIEYSFLDSIRTREINRYHRVQKTYQIKEINK